MIITPILTTSLIHFYLERLGECTLWTWGLILAAQRAKFLFRRNLDSLDCVRLPLALNAFRASDHNALRHLTSWRHILHEFFRAGKPLIRNYIGSGNYILGKLTKAQHSLSVDVLVLRRREMTLTSIPTGPRGWLRLAKMSRRRRTWSSFCYRTKNASSSRESTAEPPTRTSTKISCSRLPLTTWKGERCASRCATSIAFPANRLSATWCTSWRAWTWTWTAKRRTTSGSTSTKTRLRRSVGRGAFPS